jgi:glutamate-1-semialdehyde 2,1-aminomutase
MYQAGTLSGNPVAVAAGLATINMLRDNNIYENLERLSVKLSNAIIEQADRFGVSIQINRIGSLMTVFFSENPVISWDGVVSTDRTKYTKFFRELLDGGVYLAPSPFEAMFVSNAHNSTDIDKTISVMSHALSNL